MLVVAEVQVGVRVGAPHLITMIMMVVVHAVHAMGVVVSSCSFLLDIENVPEYNCVYFLVIICVKEHCESLGGKIETPVDSSGNPG